MSLHHSSNSSLVGKRAVIEGYTIPPNALDPLQALYEIGGPATAYDVQVASGGRLLATALAKTYKRLARLKATSERAPLVTYDAATDAWRTSDTVKWFFEHHLGQNLPPYLSVYDTPRPLGYEPELNQKYKEWLAYCGVPLTPSIGCNSLPTLVFSFQFDPQITSSQGRATLYQIEAVNKAYEDTSEFRVDHGAYRLRLQGNGLTLALPLRSSSLLDEAWVAGSTLSRCFSTIATGRHYADVRCYILPGVTPDGYLTYYPRKIKSWGLTLQSSDCKKVPDWIREDFDRFKGDPQRNKQTAAIAACQWRWDERQRRAALFKKAAPSEAVSPR